MFNYFTCIPLATYLHTFEVYMYTSNLRLKSERQQMRLIVIDFLDMWDLIITYFLKHREYILFFFFLISVCVTVPDVLTQSLGVKLKENYNMVATLDIQQC